MRRLFFDVETSFGLATVFQIGHDVNIPYTNLKVEPHIVCICYKFQGEKKVKSLEWDKGNEKQMIKSFIEVLEKTDEAVAHFGDGFDMPLIRGRALKYRLPMAEDYTTVDTYKMASMRGGRGVKLMSRKLDWLGEFLGVGRKISTPSGLWDLVSNPFLFPHKHKWDKAYKDGMAQMVHYCKGDVELLERVYLELAPYVAIKTNAAVMNEDHKWNCPSCGSGHVIQHEWRVSSMSRKMRMRCKDCKRHFRISEALHRQRLQFLMDLKTYNQNLK